MAENVTDQELSQREQAVLLFASGKSITAVAAAVGLSARQLHRYREEPEFRRQITLVKAALLEQAGAVLADRSTRAAEVLGELLEVPATDAIRLQASSKLLDLALRVRDQTELAERIQAIEEKMGRNLSLLERVKRLEQAARIDEPAVVEEAGIDSGEFLARLEADFADELDSAGLRQDLADVRRLIAAGDSIDINGPAAWAWDRLLVLVRCAVDGVPPITETEIAELSAWYKVHRERLRRYAKPHQFCRGGAKIEAYIIEGLSPTVTFQVANQLGDPGDRWPVSLMLRELRRLDTLSNPQGLDASTQAVELAKPLPFEPPPTNVLDISQEEPVVVAGVPANGGVEHQKAFGPGPVDIRSSDRTARTNGPQSLIGKRATCFTIESLTSHFRKSSRA